MSKHSPGPWEVNPRVAQVDAMPAGLPVCQLLWPTRERTENETEANARLIAAAPDMLAAINFLLDCSAPMTAQQKECWISLTEARAKATGRAL